MTQNKEHLDLVAATLAAGATPLLGSSYINSYDTLGQDTRSPEGRTAIAAKTAVSLFKQIRDQLSQEDQKHQG